MEQKSKTKTQTKVSRVVNNKKLTLHERLFNLQNEMGTLSKDKTNAFFKQEYLSLAGLIKHLRPLLEKNGLILSQPIMKNAVVTIISDLEGNHLSSKLKLPVIDNPQKIGSAITYYRRYTLQSLLAIQAQDDDGEGSLPNPTKKLQVGTQTFHATKTKLEKEETTMDIVKKHFIVDKQVEQELMNF